ncbi:hypothetical protein GCM10011529_18100 [Polymorphobacter glacialis]|uniref:Molecular chaperone DnaJ n=1 Tax=Sandarakinorhabdus glacialis TaxID=1614636 RepID=A0A916ZSH0_9SPHN|nr:molecular chaperone DnaJ [Polymorphobacter glacialis]GGE12138.1 hypothetical protein GCM10011529_18100 [Polymorphobacter glacialis]
MGLSLILAAALAWWLHKDGKLVPNLWRLGGTAAAGLLAVRLLTTGQPVLALVAAGLAYGWWLTQKRKPAKTPAITDEASALALLGLQPGADADLINAAWRARMQAAHPDAGGSNDAAHAATAARDLLLNKQRK